MTLLRAYRRLLPELARAEQSFLQATMLTAVRDRHARRHRIEGALSDAWQAYCDFVREICVISSLGCTTVDGLVCAPSVVPLNWERVSYIALRAAKNHSVVSGNTNYEKWKEPTWGDVDKIDAILTALGMVNSGTIRSSLLSGAKGPKHCQLVRNACAHKNDQTLKVVIDLAVQYLAHPIWIPSEAATWRDSVTKRPAFLEWIDDMRTNALNAVQ